MRNIAIVLAGGIGSRMGADLPKQFLPLAGRKILEHSIHTFNAHASINEVAVVIHPLWRSEVETLAEANRWQKLTKVIDGGEERYQSSLNAILAYSDYDSDTNLLFHDAARPLVSAAVIDRVVKALQQHEAVGVGIPSTDTVWEVRTSQENNGTAITVAHIPERHSMWLAQTPQAFRLPLIRDAYQRAAQDSYTQATDDCGMVQRYRSDVAIHVVEGEEQNFKITTPADLLRASNYIQTNPHGDDC